MPKAGGDELRSGTMGDDQPTLAGVEPGELASHDDAPASDTLPSGTQVGHYLVSSAIGHGGMGHVYEAWDLRLERRVALKILRPDRFAAGKEGQLRLLREARALARVAHPNVVPVFDVGRFGGRVYVAMEYVPGETLDTWLARPHPWQEVLEVFLPAAQGLLAVHEIGLVHRDFKPSNVLVGADGRARVMDFGLARLGGDPTGTGQREITDPLLDTPTTSGSSISIAVDLDTPLTVVGTVVGTPPYMAPEQHHGLHVDPRADQYSWCVALWEALFGHRPFVAANIDKLARLKQKGPPSPPADTTVPGWLVACVRRGLAPRPERRFASMRELIATIERGRAPTTLRNRSIAVLGAAALGAAAWVSIAARNDHACADPPAIDDVWNDARATAFADTLRATDRAHAASTAGHVVERTEAWVKSWRDEHRRMCATTPVDLAVRDCLDAGLSTLDASLSALSAAPPDVALQAALDSIGALPLNSDCRTAKARSMATLRPEHGDEVMQIRRHLAASLAHGRLGDFSGARVEAETALELADALPYPSLRAEAMLALGRAAIRKRDPSEGTELLREAALLAQSVGDDARAAEAAAELVLWLATIGADYDEADRWARVGQAAIQRAPPGPEIETKLVHAMAVLDYQRDRFDAAEAAFRRVLQYEESRDDPRPVNLAFALDDLARVAARRGDIATARSLSTRALGMLEEHLGPDHPTLGTMMAHGAFLAAQAKEYDEAVAMNERALAILEQAYGPEHPAVARAVGGLASAYGMRGDYDQALLLQERELAMVEATVGSDHPDYAVALGNLAITHDRLGHHEDGALYHARALAVFEETSGPVSANAARAHNHLGMSLDALERRDDARVHFVRALEICEAVFGRDHIEVAHPIGNLALMDRHDGDLASARTKLERAVEVLDVPERPDDAQLTHMLLDLAEWSLDDRDPTRARTALDRLAALGEHHLPPAEQARLPDVRRRVAEAL